MADDIEQLLVDVRASTSGFTADVQQMRSSFDSILVDGLGRAGDVLERGLLSAIRRGSLGFEDLRRVALGVIGDIAANAIRAGLGSLGSGGGGGGLGGGQGGLLNLVTTILGSALGQPGRATGGLVSAGRYDCGPRATEQENQSRQHRAKSFHGGLYTSLTIPVLAPNDFASMSM